MYSRRDFVKMAMAGIPLSRAALGATINSVVNGVRLGAITYSFRELPRTPGAGDAVDVMIKACTECGIGEIELYSPQLEPAPPNTGSGRPDPEAQRAARQALLSVAA